MKYKRCKTNVSKYVSSVSRQTNQDGKKFRVLKKKTVIAFMTFFIVVSLTKSGILSPHIAEKYIFASSDPAKYASYAVKTDKYFKNKLSFLNIIGYKATDFYSHLFSGKTPDKTGAYAKEKNAVKKVSVPTESIEPKDKSKVIATDNIKFSLMYPLYGRISSQFGERVHPVNNEEKFHNGIDIAVSVGTEVKCACDGTVTKAEYNEYSGNYIVVSHQDGYTTSYAHLSEIAVSVGDEAKCGTVIGYSGSTGTATGPHLHFELRKDGTPCNPMNFLSGDSY